MIQACSIYCSADSEVNDLVTLQENRYKIALKGYKEICLNSRDEIAVIKGIWLSLYIYLDQGSVEITMLPTLGRATE